ILSDLKDLKKTHENSKGNSDHSRNSRSVPLKINENYSGAAKARVIEEPGQNLNGWRSKEPIAADSGSLVESSKESTISTLTQSNGVFSPGPTGARSTPWIEGPADQLRDLNEPTPKGDSTHIREAINGLLEYTSWLENLNPLRESTIKTSREAKNREGVEPQISERYSNRQDSGRFTEEFDVNTGDPVVGKEAYWRSLADADENEATNNIKLSSKAPRSNAPDDETD
ncbi:MAG: hypothetical protein SGILL_008859, partial [Bacillariaceae sp.]